jgi:hypothetical protein
MPVQAATLMWYDALPTEARQFFPRSPMHAFRIDLENPDRMPSVFRNHSLAATTQAANVWFTTVPANLRQHLPDDPVQALQSAVLRFVPRQIEGSKQDNITEEQAVNNTSLAFLKTQKAAVKRLEEWR